MKLTELMPSIFKMIPYEYEKIKSAQYDELVEDLLSTALPSSMPKLKQISGIPGSGKTTFCKMNKNDEYLFIGFDEIMHKISGYKNDVEMLGLIKAFEKWELVARTIGYELLFRAISKRISVLFEHSGVNDAHVELFKNAKVLGYETEVIFTICDIETALKRAGAREKEILRHTPRILIEERAVLLEKYINIYMKTADKVVIYNTSGSVPKLAC